MHKETRFKKKPQAKCNPQEIALKSFFLGPQAENATWVLPLLDGVFNRWVQWRRSLFPQDGKAISVRDQKRLEFVARRQDFERAAYELATRFEEEVPKFSPRYIGHMFSEVSLPALVGHIVTLLHNPNNISGESSRVGTQIEDEAVRSLLLMTGFSEKHGMGHFTSGGTLANFEALFRARSRCALWLSAEAALVNATQVHQSQKFDPVMAAHSGWERFDETILKLKERSVSEKEVLRWNMSYPNPMELAARLECLSKQEFLGPVILVPENKHYSWKKGAQLFGGSSESIWPIRLDSRGRLSVEHLKRLIDLAISKGRPIQLVVSVVGTTELGGIDPVCEVQDVVDQWKNDSGLHIWHHVDAAYGGLFRTIDLKKSKAFSHDVLRALAAIPRVNSITLDPHKLGYVPYSSGAFLTREKRDYYFMSFDSAPYIDFDAATDRGPFTIEGSRSATGAVATWMTAKTIGLHPKGYGLLLERTARICRELESKIEESGIPVQLAPGCDTNILCFTCANPGETLSVSNQRTIKVFEAFSPKKKGAFIVSKTSLNWHAYSAYLDEWVSRWSGRRDEDEVVLIRMCMMNPFFGSIETRVNYAESFIDALGCALERQKACQDDESATA